MKTKERKNGIDHAVDIFYRYGTDANAALKAGNNLRVAALLSYLLED